MRLKVTMLKTNYKTYKTSETKLSIYYEKNMMNLEKIKKYDE